MTASINFESAGTLIAWAHETINFWWGCNMVSAECKGCYGDAAMSKKGLNFNVFRPTSDWDKAYRLNARAAHQGKCALVFTCSYSDFFHPAADRWRPKAWQIIRDCKNLIWLVLTKRPERITQCLPDDWGDGYDNVWLGVTVGVKASYPRLDELRKTHCKRRFISIEPLLESLNDINLAGFSWLLVGGMSGPTWEKNKMKIEWAAELYERTQKLPDVFYFFKQCSGFRSECGIDGLGRYLKLVDNGKPALLRQIPRTALPMLPLSIEKGHRFTDRDWNKYQLDPPSLESGRGTIEPNDGGAA